MIRKFIAAVIIFIAAFSLKAQKISYPHHQLGIGYSSFSGSGFSYLVEFNKNFAVNANGMIYYQGDKPPDNIDQYGLIGLELQRNLYNSEDVRYYLFGGAGLCYIEKRRIETVKINDATFVTKTKSIDRIWNYGAGAGVEYNIFPRASVSFGIGLLYQTSDNTSFSEFFDRSPNSTTYIGIGASFSLRFRF